MKPAVGHGIYLASDNGGWEFLSYPELAARARRAGAELAAAGLQPGDVMCMLMPTGFDCLATFFGAWVAGATPCMVVPPSFQSARQYLPHVTAILERARPALVAVSGGYEELVAGAMAARLADLLGRRRVFLAGVALFTLASLFCGLSQNATEVLSMRAAQGVGAALMSPAALSILVTSFMDLGERNKAFGIWGAVIGVGAATGVLLGGALGNVDWRWAFWVNVPVGVVIIVAAVPLIPPGRPVGPRPQSDVDGALTGTAGMLSLVYGIVTTSTAGWTSARTLSAFAAGIVLLAAFVFIEHRSPAPLLPLRLFRQRALCAGAAGEFLTTAMMMPSFFLIPLYFEDLRGYSPLHTGLAFLPVSITLVVVAPIVSQIINKTGPQPLYLAGTVMFAVMIALLVRLPLSIGYTREFLPAITALSLGTVLCLIPTPVVGTAQATEADAGTVSAVLNTSTQVGGAFGLAVAVTVFNSRANHLAASGVARPEAMDRGFQTAFLALAAFLVLSMINGIVGFRGLGRVVAEREKALQVAQRPGDVLPDQPAD